MEEKTKNQMWGCLGLLVIAGAFSLMVYGGITLFKEIIALL